MEVLALIARRAAITRSLTSFSSVIRHLKVGRDTALKVRTQAMQTMQAPELVQAHDMAAGTAAQMLKVTKRTKLSASRNRYNSVRF